MIGEWLKPLLEYLGLSLPCLLLLAILIVKIIKD